MATYAAWRDDRTIRLGAGLAYYGLFSLTSVLAVAFGLFRILGRSAAVGEALVERFEDLLGPEGAATATQLISQLDGAAGTQLGLIGLGSLLVTGSLFFLALEDALNQIWGVPVRHGIRTTVRRRLMSLLVLLGAVATLVAALAVQAVTAVFERLLPDATPMGDLLGTIMASGLGWAVLAGALALLFKYVPSIDEPWTPILVSAIVTSVFLVIGTSLIGWYLREFGASSIGGAVSTPIAVLLWIYYEAQILLAGAQLGKVLARTPVPRGEDAGDDGEDAGDDASTAGGGDDG